MSEVDVNQMLVNAIDTLIIARAKQRLSEFVENASGASYHAETAVQTKQIIKDILDMKDRTLVASLVKEKEKPMQPLPQEQGGNDSAPVGI